MLEIIGGVIVLGLIALGLKTYLSETATPKGKKK
jgi:hypothetical protein